MRMDARSVSGARSKISRIACPWLIRRLVDLRAVILFVAASEVEGVAERHDEAPFDIEGRLQSSRRAVQLRRMPMEFSLSIDNPRRQWLGRRA
ncbi:MULTISPECIES: chromate resistance protein ChrB domain-containing protein [Paracoccus]|jgi:Uncharacterized conserved protein